MTEQPNYLLLCPTCKKEVTQHHKDDVGTLFYACENGHQTSYPLKKELDWIGEFGRRFFKAAEGHPEALADYKPSKLYPAYPAFCDNPEDSDKPGKQLKGFKPARVAQYLAREEHFKTDRETDILYYGDEEKGTWTREGETKLKEIVTLILGEEDKKYHCENILHTLKNLTYCDVEFSQKIAVQNGLLDVETGELKPFSLEEMAFYELDCTYNKEADCPSFKEFLKQALSPEDIPTLQEWSGYLLLPDYRFHKLLWIHGQGRNGKGVWQRTMESILGSQNVSSIGLEELDGNHRFALERLYGRLFNPCSEPTTNRVLQTSLLKKATGQDTIEAELKGAQKRVKFRNTAKITIVANKFPKVKDETTAFKERRLFITFPNEFTGKDCITNLENAWLNDPIERMGILNWMIQGLQRLFSNGEFTESKTQAETEIAFDRASDTISAFLKEMAIYDKNIVTARSVAFEAYKNYCEVFGLETENERRFAQRLKETPKIQVTTVSTPQRERAWKGLGLKKIDDDGQIVTHVTDVTGPALSDRFTNTNLKEYSAPVTSVTPVTAKDCFNFHKPSCEHSNPTCLLPTFDCPGKCRSYKPTLEETPSFEDKCEPPGDSQA